MRPDAPRKDDELLVCIYYRVAGADAGRAIDAAREIQRTLGQRFPGARAEVLLRWEPSRLACADAVPTPLPAVPDTPPTGDADAHATLMETYRFAASACAVPALLAELDACAAPLAGLLRGARHVELFRPCA